MKKALSVLLAIMLVFTLVPLGAFDASATTSLTYGLNHVATVANDIFGGKTYKQVTDLTDGGVSISWPQYLSGYGPYGYNVNLGQFPGEDGFKLQFSNYINNATRTEKNAYAYGQIVIVLSSTTANDRYKIKKDVPFLQVDTVNGKLMLCHCLDIQFGAIEGFAADQEILTSDLLKADNFERKAFSFSFKNSTTSPGDVDITVEVGGDGNTNKGQTVTGVLDMEIFNAIQWHASTSTFISVGGLDNNGTITNPWSVEFYGYKRLVHVYDNVCDAECNECGNIRNAPHIYDNTCDAECNGCGVVREITHSFEWVIDKEETAFENGIKHEACTVCGEIQNENTEIDNFGTTGDCAWVLDGTVLTISGNGATADYCDGMGCIYPSVEPDFDDEFDYKTGLGYSPFIGVAISSIVIGEGVTALGDYLFEFCEVEKIYLPLSLTAIGHGTFGYCDSIKRVYYAGSQDDKEIISISSGAEYLLNAIWYYNYGLVCKEHTYDNACDDECNVCSVTREISHIYNGDHVCDVCGHKSVDIGTVYPDTSSNAWYSDAVAYCYSTGVLTGYSNGKFGTSDGIQRQDFLVMLARYDGADLIQYENGSSFCDVGSNTYFAAAVNWGYQNGIVTGYNDGRFGVGDKITREQIVTFLYRYAKYKGINADVEPSVVSAISVQYKDYNRISTFSKDAVHWALDRGVISGKDPQTIAPQGNAQRCEVAQIMYNIFKKDIF